MQGTTAKTALKTANARNQRHSFANMIAAEPAGGGRMPRGASAPAFKRTMSGASLTAGSDRSASPQRVAVKLDRERARLSMEEARELYPPAECILDEVVHRLRAADGTWRRRRMILHRDIILFVDMEVGEVTDSIPTEVVSGAARCHEHDEQGSDEMAFQIMTKQDSEFHGVTFTCRSRGEMSARMWVDKLAEHIERLGRGPTALQKYQAAARKIERNVWFSVTAAALIMGNFFFICMEAQITPAPGSAEERTLEIVDLMFTLAFTIELSVILSGRLPYAFWHDGWNIFDFIIVTISLLQLGLKGILEVQQFRLFRMFRVARVLRVFGKLQQLRHIVNSITRAIVPVCDAIFICLMVVFMYATIGVDVFRKEAPDEFDNFFRAIWTLFSVVTFEDWPPVLHPFPEGGEVKYVVVVYVYSYVGIINYVLLQVLVAVLLESFFTERSMSEVVDKREESDAHRLDPLMEVLLVHFNTEDDLANRITGFFSVFDADDSGSLTLTELQEGIAKLPLSRKCKMTPEDYEEMTANLVGFDEDGEKTIDFAAFDQLIRKELRAFAQRNLASSLRNAVDVEAQTLLGALKMMLVDSKTTQNLLSQEDGLLRDGGPRGWNGSFSRRGRPESPTARKHLAIDTPTFQRLRSGVSDTGSMSPSDFGSEHDERRAKSGYPKQRQGVALYSPAKHAFDTRDKIVKWRQGNTGWEYAEDNRSRSPELMKHKNPYDQASGSSPIVGNDPSSCRGVEVHLLNISSMLARIEDCLTPIRREVEEVKNTVQNGGMECHHPSCTKCAERSAHTGRGRGKEADVHKDKSDASSLSAWSQHTKNLEMQLLHLQAENAGYREQQLQQSQQQASPAPLQRPTTPLNHSSSDAVQTHQASSTDAERKQRSSKSVGSDWPQLNMQESNPNTPRELSSPLDTTRSMSKPPPKWFSPALDSDGNDICKAPLVYQSHKDTTGLPTETVIGLSSHQASSPLVSLPHGRLQANDQQQQQPPPRKNLKSLPLSQPQQQQQISNNATAAQAHVQPAPPPVKQQHGPPSHLVATSTAVTADVGYVDPRDFQGHNGAAAFASSPFHEPATIQHAPKASADQPGDRSQFAKSVDLRLAAALGQNVVGRDGGVPNEVYESSPPSHRKPQVNSSGFNGVIQ